MQQDMERVFLDAISREPKEPAHRAAYHDWLLEQCRSAPSQVKTLQDLKGRTLKACEMDKDRERLIFTLDTGAKVMLWHNQSCCETVSIEDVEGRLSDLVGSPLLLVEEESNDEDKKPEDESGTWTFYRFATVKGYVTVRWYGSSNGYYSESVDFMGEPDE